MAYARRSTHERCSMMWIITCSAWLVWAPEPTLARDVATHRVDIAYEEPEDPRLAEVAASLRSMKVLERLQTLLSPLRLPRRLPLKLSGCDGESNAWFDGEGITVCYEYMRDAVVAARKRSRPASLSPTDAVAGAFFDVFLHEVGHAIFHFLDIPILGREEDAADQVAAYILLSFGREESYKLIIASAFFYADQVGASSVRRLNRKLLLARAKSHADVHGTPAQRLYNVMCIAYGADPKLFSPLVESGALPKERADGCADEFLQVQRAYWTLIRPHIDPELAKAVMQQQWLPSAR